MKLEIKITGDKTLKYTSATIARDNPSGVSITLHPKDSSLPNASLFCGTKDLLNALRIIDFSQGLEK